jgi:hypothetical protein
MTMVAKLSTKPGTSMPAMATMTAITVMSTATPRLTHMTSLAK